jgi:trimethylamine--corrinoid protein Co-methyltransferase
MTGGGGESALANAAAAQLLHCLDMPATVSAGMTDSKIEDVQAGYEKGYSITLAAQAGADMINLSVGMLGSIMVASAESLLIDNDMCGAILRTVRGIDVSDELLDLDSIERVVCGEGHFLGEAQTRQLMKTEYVYPELGDRQSVADWLDGVACKSGNAHVNALPASSLKHNQPICRQTRTPEYGTRFQSN